VTTVVKISLFVGVASTRKGSRKCCLHVSQRPLGEDGQARSHRRPRTHELLVSTCKQHQTLKSAPLSTNPATAEDPREPEPEPEPEQASRCELEGREAVERDRIYCYFICQQTMAAKRLIKELDQYNKDPSPAVLRLEPASEDDIFHLTAVLRGPDGTAYDGRSPSQLRT
jgi:hypothetical protein